MEVLVDFLMGFSGPLPYILIFTILLACGLGLPIPEDITLFAAGVLCYAGKADVFVMIGIAMFGVMFGDSFIFLLGRKYGRSLTKLKFFAKALPEKRLNMVEKKLKEQGSKVIFAARFMPGLRAPIFFSAGTLKLPFQTFFFFDGFAALISVPAIVYTVFYFGDHLEPVIDMIKKIEGGIVFVILGIVAAVFIKWKWNRSRESK